MSIRDYPGLKSGCSSILPGDLKRHPKDVPQVCKPIPPLVTLLLPAGGVAEFRFHPSRRWRFDYAWPQHKIALEVEGGAYTKGRHTRGKGFVNDMDKYNQALQLGWKVIRVTPQQLDSGEAGSLVQAAIEST